MRLHGAGQNIPQCGDCAAARNVGTLHPLRNDNYETSQHETNFLPISLDNRTPDDCRGLACGRRGLGLGPCDRRSHGAACPLRHGLAERHLVRCRGRCRRPLSTASARRRIHAHGARRGLPHGRGCRPARKRAPSPRRRPSLGRCRPGARRGGGLGRPCQPCQADGL